MAKSKAARTTKTEFKRDTFDRAHTILMEVHMQASLLAAALDVELLPESEEENLIGYGGPEFTAKAIKARIGEALHFLDSTALGSEADAIRHELFGTWNLAALSAHALASDAPLDGEGVSFSPAYTAVRLIEKSADELTDRLDMLRMREKRAA